MSTKKLVTSADGLNDDDADDSNTDSSSDHQIRRRRTPKRSATVSPATRHRFCHNRSTHRRRSDVYLGSDVQNFPLPVRGRFSLEKMGIFDLPLRKTNSEPSVEQQQQALTLDAMRSLMESYQALPQTMNEAANELESAGRIGKRRTPSTSVMQTDVGLFDIFTTARQSLASDESEEDIMNTDIEELRDAVESIQSLQRVLKIPNQQHPNGSSPINDLPSRNSSIASNTDSTGTLKGITTNLGGHPRGVMQFLPSTKYDQFQPTLDSYTWNKQQSNYSQIVRRKTSAPEGYLKFSRQSSAERSSPHPRPTMRLIRSSDTEPDLFSSVTELNNKGVDSIAGVSRFSRLLNSLKGTRQNAEQWQYPGALLMPPDASVSQRQLQQSLMQADQLLWKQRSRASLRRHQDIRNMAVRELFDTERTFVESLEYLMQKYMRPLKQPLECTLIETDLVDKIFYKIPEILAHHQVLYAALTTRMESLKNDTIIGDVLLAHFTKQSMIETFMAFVDNYKHAKQAIWEARQRPAFEKYYMRCSREHRTKLDLDSLLILPIQRIPRYELILKQILKHTSVDHCDYDKLLMVQKHVHHLAVVINCQREETEKMEQRLREIEAIVDGLDDLVSRDRIFIRYDVVSIKDSMNVKKMRCIFMMSDQLIVTSIRKRIRGFRNQQSLDFLDSNRFKLLIKISLDDVDLIRDTIPLLHNVEEQLRSVQEDVNIISKIIDLAKLLRVEHSALTEMMETMYSTRNFQLKLLQEQMTSNPDLTTINLKVSTFNGIENLTIQFTNAEKRAIWENAFLEAKSNLKNTMQVEQNPPQLKSILVHRSRQGLTFSKATPTLAKSTEGAPNVWICSSDKFSGQVAIVNVNNEPSVENSSYIGNSGITAICSVPSSRKATTCFKTKKSSDTNDIEMELDSSSSDNDNSDSDSTSSIQSTIWIGNEDGEIYIFNYLDNVRLKTREKIVRLSAPITDIVYLEEQIFISTSSKNQSQLYYFQRTKENNWDLDKPKQINLNLPKSGKLNCMVAVTNRLCFGSRNSVFMLNPIDLSIEKSTTLETPEEVGFLASLGSIIYVAFKKSTTVVLLNAFTLEYISEFNINPILTKTLSTKEDVIRNHKLGNLRITALLCVKSQLWIGSSAGIILCTPACHQKSAWAPNFHVCSISHIGPCRFLTSVNVNSLSSTNNFNNRKISLNAALLQQYEQVYIISGGNGIDNLTLGNANEETGGDDACNHLIFWQL